MQNDTCAFNIKNFDDVYIFFDFFLHIQICYKIFYLNHKTVFKNIFYFSCYLKKTKVSESRGMPTQSISIVCKLLNLLNKKVNFSIALNKLINKYWNNLEAQK